MGIFFGTRENRVPLTSLFIIIIVILKAEIKVTISRNNTAGALYINSEKLCHNTAMADCQQLVKRGSDF